MVTEFIDLFEQLRDNCVQRMGNIMIVIVQFENIEEKIEFDNLVTHPMIKGDLTRNVFLFFK